MRTCTSLSSLLAVLALGCPADDDGATGDDTGSSSGSSSGPGTTHADTSSSTTVTTIDETSTGPVDSSESSTGVPTTCGNAELDDGEECDDGNNDEGDACHADCTNAFEIPWTNLHDGPSSSFDSANDVWIDDAGAIFAAGYETAPMNGNDMWIQQYMADGSEGALFNYDEGDDDFCNSLAVAPAGDLLCAGGVTTMTDLDVVTVRVATDLADLTLVERFDGPGMGPGANDDYDVGRAAVGTDDGGFVVVGHVAVDGEGLNMFVGRYDADAMPVFRLDRDDAMMGDNVARAVLMSADDEAIVFGNDSVDATTAAGVVAIYDADGNLVDDSQTFDFVVRDATYDADGNFVVVGQGDLGNTLDDAIVRKYAPDFTEIWSVTFDGSTDIDLASGVHVAADGTVYAAGTTYRTGQQGNGFVAAWDADGNPLWSDEYNTMDVDLEDGFTGVYADANGDVVVVGFATILGHQTDALVRKYHPL